MSRILSVLGSFLRVLAGVVITINVCSSLVGGVWLAFIHQWRLILLGVVMGICLPTLYAIVIAPGMGLAAISAPLIEKGRRFLGGAIALFATLYSNSLIAVWVAGAFSVCVIQVEAHSPVPFVLWGYAVAVGPLSYMAEKDSEDSVGTALGVFFAQISYFLATILWLSGTSFGGIFRTLILMAVLPAATQVILGLWLSAPSRAANTPNASGRAEINEDDLVYVNDNSKRYHRAGCRMLRPDQFPVSRIDAEASGCSPCRICRPTPEQPPLHGEEAAAAGLE